MKQGRSVAGAPGRAALRAEWINIGFIRKPHGLRGYVRVEGLSDAPDRFEDLDRIDVELRDGRRESLEIERCSRDGNGWLMKFLGIDTTENAERLRSAYIQVPGDAVADLPEDAFYVFEVEGCAVVSEDGTEIGIVREVLSLPANDVFVVDTPAGEAMVPVVRDIVVKLDPDESKIVIRPIPGLFA